MSSWFPPLGLGGILEHGRQRSLVRLSTKSQLPPVGPYHGAATRVAIHLSPRYVVPAPVSAASANPEPPVSAVLNLLGGARVGSKNATGTGRAGQPRRLAILSLLALAPRRTMTRDRIIAFLWREHSSAAE